LRGDADVSELIGEIDASGTPFVSAVTVLELREGIHLADATDAERSRVSELLTGINELPFDRACAMRAGEIYARLVSAGEPIDETDVMIAATATVNDQPVVTGNTERFERVGGLDVVTY
jgi:predicted nucleic acid-binding protein